VRVNNVNTNVFKQYWGRISAAFFVLLSLLTLLHYNTTLTFQDYASSRLTDATLNRIALDIPELKLADQRFNQAVNTSKVARYIDQLNDYLARNSHPIRVIAIQDTHVKANDIAKSQITKNLLFPRQTISIRFAILPMEQNYHLYTLPLILSIILTYLAVPFLVSKPTETVDIIAEQEDEPCRLVVDLTTRTLYLNKQTELSVPLANKPFCFYVAMLDFCADEKEAALYHNKSLPEEFLALTSKYFTRLMDLGHTKRKRPDFNANIDKMLSEIRNALDEIFQTESEAKHKFYPKKAQGEGSRSKLNNFALSGLSCDDFELIGK